MPVTALHKQLQKSQRSQTVSPFKEDTQCCNVRDSEGLPAQSHSGIGARQRQTSSIKTDGDNKRNAKSLSEPKCLTLRKALHQQFQKSKRSLKQYQTLMGRLNLTTFVTPRAHLRNHTQQNCSRELQHLASLSSQVSRTNMSSVRYAGDRLFTLRTAHQGTQILMWTIKKHIFLHAISVGLRPSLVVSASRYDSQVSDTLTKPTELHIDGPAVFAMQMFSGERGIPLFS